MWFPEQCVWELHVITSQHWQTFCRFLLCALCFVLNVTELLLFLLLLWCSCWGLRWWAWGVGLLIGPEPPLLYLLHFDLWDQRKQCASICHMARSERDLCHYLDTGTAALGLRHYWANICHVALCACVTTITCGLFMSGHYTKPLVSDHSADIWLHD